MKVDPKWFSREKWTLIEAAQICAGVDPYQGGKETDDPHQISNQIAEPRQRGLFNELYARSKDALGGTLSLCEPTRTGAKGNNRVRPGDYVIWVADTRFLESLEPLIDLEGLIVHIFGARNASPVDDELIETELGYTVNGAARDLARRYPEVHEGEMRQHIKAAITHGILKPTIVLGSADEEYPMMVNDSSNLGSAYAAALPENAFTGFVAAHEILHSWFPFYMGINEKRYPFMDEG
jgi:hypothetical protein